MKLRIEAIIELEIGAKDDISATNYELRIFQDLYNKSHEDIDFDTIRHLKALKKRLTDELNRWTHYKNIALHRRSKEGAE